VAQRLRRLALLEGSCQGASEDFVPPAAQRKAVSRMNSGCFVRSATTGDLLTPISVMFGVVSTLRAPCGVNVLAVRVELGSCRPTTHFRIHRFQATSSSSGRPHWRRRGTSMISKCGSVRLLCPLSYQRWVRQGLRPKKVFALEFSVLQHRSVSGFLLLRYSRGLRSTSWTDGGITAFCWELYNTANSSRPNGKRSVPR